MVNICRTDDEKIYDVRIVDPPSNTGMSVTNNIERIAREIAETFIPEGSHVRWTTLDSYGEECEVQFSVLGFGQPHWIYIRGGRS